jgi:transcriptional regulator with XRE-family HTH domain
VHALTDRAVRIRAGISERKAAALAHVSRVTLSRHERGEEIRDEELSARLSTFYAWLRLGLSWSESVESGDPYADDEGEAPTVRPADSGVHLIETMPAPPRVPREFQAA